MKDKVSLIGVIENISGDVIGYRFMETASLEVVKSKMGTSLQARKSDQSVTSVIRALNKNPDCLDGITYDIKSKKLVGTSCSLSRYPKLLQYIDGSIRTVKSGIIVLYSIGNVGYRVANQDGLVMDVTDSDLISSSQLVNAKVVDRNGLKFMSAIKDTFDTMEIEESYKFKGYKPAEVFKSEEKTVLTESEKKLANEGVNITGLREIRNYKDDPRVAKCISGTDALANKTSMRDKKSSDGSGMTIDEKMTYGLYAISNIRPFYYSVLNTLKRVETFDVPTLGVSIDTLYWNPEFVDRLRLDELLFILMHEVGHIVGKHSAREKGREHDLWNCACDLFINKALADECGLTGAESPRLVEPDVSARNSGRDRSYNVVLPASALFNETIDIQTDTPESIYQELLDEMKNSGSKGSNSGNQRGTSSFGSGTGGLGASSQERQALDRIEQGASEVADGVKSGNTSQIKSGLNKISQGLNELSAEAQGEKDDTVKNAKSQIEHGKHNISNGLSSENKKQAESGSRQITDAVKELKEKYSGGSDSNTDDSNADFTDGNGKTQGSGGNRMQGRMFRGKELNGSTGDIIDDPNSKNMGDRERDQAANSLLSSAIQRHRQSGNQFGGESGSFMEREAVLAMAPKADWRRLVKQYANKKSNQKEVDHKSYNRKDISRSRVITGRKDSTFNIPRAGVKKPNTSLEGLKICVDTSGSISNDDIGKMFGQVLQLAMLGRSGHKIEVKKPEILYWDTQVRANYPLNKIDDALKARPYGGGGTDANCVFEYLNTCKSYKTGKIDKPELVLMFTDGYIPDVIEKYAHSKYKVIWIISSNGNTEFKPPFGIKADFNY